MISTFVIVGGVVLALILPIWIYPLLNGLGVVDVPNARSSHEVSTIRGMGVALAIAASVATAILVAFRGDGYEKVLSIALLGFAAAALGFAEDLRGIRVAKRAGLQLLLGAGFGCLVAWSSDTNWVWIPLGAVAVAAYINVANFMDGINGISGLHGGVAGITYAFLGAITDRIWMIELGLLAAGVFLAFLPWNLSRRRVFLGDVGSYLLGAWVAGLAVLAVASGLDPLLAVGPTVIYLADTGFTLLLRIRRGERWFEAHRSHVYQQLTALYGGKHVAISLLVTGFSALTALVSFLSLLSSPIASAVSLLLMLLIATVYLYLPKILNRSGSALLENLS